MSLLDRKLFRDLFALKSQAVAVALVMACGLAMMIMTRSLILSLESARSSYYQHYRFADVFARLKRAPDFIAQDIARVPGIAGVQTGIAVQVTLDLPGMAEPATALINSLPDRRSPELNRLCLRAGRFLKLDSHHEILVGEAFAEVHRLKPGDTVSAILNGRKLPLRIAGIVLSPEFVFEAPPGAALPDNRTFGVFWMRYKELAEVFSLDGAFNSVTVALGPRASEPAVIAAINQILEPFGGRGAFGRKDHASNVRVSDEIRVLQGLSFGFPLVFLSVAAFMTNAVMTRQINLQREQIAILKAFGFSNAAIAGHYLKFSLVIVCLGIAVGGAGGVLLGHRLVGMYHLFFRFPQLDFRLSAPTVVAAAIVSALAAFVGVFGSVRRAVRLPPAEAMRPEPPARFRPALLERAGLAKRISVSARMALRNLERKPTQALLTSVALSLATAILIIPNSFRDGINHILDFQWDIVQRDTVMISLVEPGPARVLHDFEHLPGVIHAEAFRGVPVELRSGNRSRRLSIYGQPAAGHLSRVLGAEQKQIPLPAYGLVLSEKLAEVLDVSLGDRIHVRVLDGSRPEAWIPITGLAQDFAGVAVYMEIDALNRLLGQGDQINGAHLMVAAGAWPAFLAAIKETPRAAGTIIKNSMRDSFRDTTAQSIGLIQTIYLFFATVVAFGIVYNSARISLSERQRELATLRVLGFTRAEVGAVLVGELVVLALVALPAGLVLGSLLAKAILTSVNTETVRLPLVLTASNYAFATLVVAVATTLSLLLACRRLNQLDLVGALKAAD